MDQFSTNKIPFLPFDPSKRSAYARVLHLSYWWALFYILHLRSNSGERHGAPWRGAAVALIKYRPPVAAESMLSVAWGFQSAVLLRRIEGSIWYHFPLGCTLGGIPLLINQPIVKGHLWSFWAPIASKVWFSNFRHPYCQSADHEGVQCQARILGGVLDDKDLRKVGHQNVVAWDGCVWSPRIVLRENHGTSIYRKFTVLCDNKGFLVSYRFSLNLIDCRHKTQKLGPNLVKVSGALLALFHMHLGLRPKEHAYFQQNAAI